MNDKPAAPVSLPPMATEDAEFNEWYAKNETGFDGQDDAAYYAWKEGRLKANARIEQLEWENKGIAEWRDIALRAQEEVKRLQKELGECSGGFETVCKEADSYKKTAAAMANINSDLRQALRDIRDATHTNAVTLRGMADMALK